MQSLMHDKWANPKAMWDERFSQAEPVYGHEPNGYLKEQAFRLEPGMKVLVPADGYGRNGLWLAKQGLQVHTVDLSPVGVERARKAAQVAGVQLKIEEADLARWNWPVAEYDAIVCIFFHLPPEARAKIHKAMVQALKPGGMIILQAFSQQQLQHASGGPKDVTLLYTPDLLRNDFAGTEALRLEEKVVQLNEGHMHSGLGAVIQGVFLRK
jgi:2-polyprenyl-3-methyl-5-hydroxy-6-metoxy-1,4-benzoquinol methylase